MNLKQTINNIWIQNKWLINVGEVLNMTPITSKEDEQCVRQRLEFVLLFYQIFVFRDVFF